MNVAESVAGPGKTGRLLVHLGMVLASLAFASWWTSHTILDPSRTPRVAHAVLGSAEVRHYVAQTIAPVAAQAVGAPSLNAATGVAPSASAIAPGTEELTRRLTAVLDRSDVRSKLEQFVGDAHGRLIGQRSAPAVLDKGTVDTLLSTAVPGLSPTDLAKVPEVKFDVPHVGGLVASRDALNHRFWLFALGALGLIVAAIATTRDRKGLVRLVGRWLIGISLAHLIVLWVVPVVVVPRLSSSPWASLIASVARALNAGIVTGLIVLVAAGVAFLVGDRFIPGLRGAGAVVPGRSHDRILKPDVSLQADPTD